jgi:hypothetical protein
MISLIRTWERADGAEGRSEATRHKRSLVFIAGVPTGYTNPDEEKALSRIHSTP